jgi:hypothetical protein
MPPAASTVSARIGGAMALGAAIAGHAAAYSYSSEAWAAMRSCYCDGATCPQADQPVGTHNFQASTRTIDTGSGTCTHITTIACRRFARFMI